MILALLPKLKLSKFLLMILMLAEDESTKVTDSAPRDKASMPKLPEPAKRSRTTLPSTSSFNTLKIDPLVLSELGLILACLTELKTRPLCLPAIIRKKISPEEMSSFNSYEVFYLFKSLGADAGDLHQILDLLKFTLGFPVVNDPLA